MSHDIYYVMSFLPRDNIHSDNLDTKKVGQNVLQDKMSPDRNALCLTGPKSDGGGGYVLPSKVIVHQELLSGSCVLPGLSWNYVFTKFS